MLYIPVSLDKCASFKWPMPILPFILTRFPLFSLSFELPDLLNSCLWVAVFGLIQLPLSG